MHVSLEKLELVLDPFDIIFQSTSVIFNLLNLLGEHLQVHYYKILRTSDLLVIESIIIAPCSYRFGVLLGH